MCVLVPDHRPQLLKRRQPTSATQHLTTVATVKLEVSFSIVAKVILHKTVFFNSLLLLPTFRYLLRSSPLDQLVLHSLPLLTVIAPGHLREVTLTGVFRTSTCFTSCAPLIELFFTKCKGSDLITILITRFVTQRFLLPLTVESTVNSTI